MDAYTTGFDELRESVRGYTPERVAEITGLAPEQIYRTAWMYANARAAFIGWTMGVNHSSKGTETVNAINNLALITGNIGRAGAAPFSITGQCNAMGTRETGFASSLPGYRKFESEPDRNELAALWGIDADRIPTARGLAYPGHHRGRARQADPRACGSSRPTPSCRSPISARCGRRSRGSSSWSCRTAMRRRRPASSPT